MPHPPAQAQRPTPTLTQDQSETPTPAQAQTATQTPSKTLAQAPPQTQTQTQTRTQSPTSFGPRVHLPPPEPASPQPQARVHFLNDQLQPQQVQLQNQAQERQRHHAETYTFDLDGGRACLDFANTRGSSPTSVDHLLTYTDLLAFAAQSNLITRRDADWLRGEAERDPVTAAGVVTRARRLRESLRTIFSAVAAGDDLSESDLGVLNFDLAISLQHARVLPTRGGGYRWGWSGRNLDAPVWPISRSAADVLTSDEERGLVRECSADDCAWLFLDTTRNRSRQWCSMQSCGNREKARRHYQRLRVRRGETEAISARTVTAAPPPGPARKTPSAGDSAARRSSSAAAPPTESTSAREATLTKAKSPRRATLTKSSST